MPRQVTRIPRVPVRTPMFDREGNLTRTWIIFFEQLANRESGWEESITSILGGDSTHVVGWDLADTTVGEDVSDPVIPLASGTVLACKIRIKVTDPDNPLEIDIRKIPSDTAEAPYSIFNTLPLIPAGEDTRDVQVFTDFADPTIAVDDDLVIDVVQGGLWQVAVYLSYTALPPLEVTLAPSLTETASLSIAA